MKQSCSLLLSLQLGILLVLQQFAAAQGFLGHEVTLYGKTYNYDNEQPARTESPYLIATVLVGSGQEYGSEIIELDESTGRISAFDFDAFSIAMDGSNLTGLSNGEANFNGIVIEDTNGTLPDFERVTIEESVSTYTSRILVSPNSIWINDEGLVYGRGAFQRLLVTFAKTSSAPQLSLNSSESGDMVLEAATQLGARYRFEESEDLISFTPIDKTFTAIAPHRAIFIKPATERMHYRLRLLEETGIPLQTDFESGAEGWASEATNDTRWELGTPNSESLTKAGSGTKAWGINLDGNYQPNAEAILRSPLVDLSRHDHEAALTFRYFIDSPEEVEGGQLRFMDESGLILHEHEPLFTGQSHTWVPFRVVLPDSLQNKEFRMEFRFLSNEDDEVGAGWFIDDVLVL